MAPLIEVYKRYGSVNNLQCCKKQETQAFVVRKPCEGISFVRIFTWSYVEMLPLLGHQLPELLRTVVLPSVIISPESARYPG